MKKLEKIFSLFGGIALAIVFVVVFGQVIGRYIVKRPLPWATDVTRIAFVASVFLGMTVGVFRKGHLNIDVLVHLLPDRAKPWMRLLSNGVTLFFLAFVFRYSIPYIRSNADQYTPYLMIPMSWVYAIVPLAAICMIFFLLDDSRRELQSLGRR